MKLSILAKSFLTCLGLWVASIALWTNVAIANPLFPEPPFLAQTLNTNSNSSELQPDETTSPSAKDPKETSFTDPKTTDKNQESAQNKQQTQSSGPYDMKAIEEFYKSLYGS